MTVNVGTMQLPVTEDADLVRTYLNGTHVSGGLWTALTRASNHDHSGGTSGVQLTATSIPDGSITTAKLDPAVLGPYALTDGSKPFTGQVSMNADVIVRDALYFGQQGSAAPADTTFTRAGTGALVLSAVPTSAITFALDGLAATDRALRFRSSGVDRWVINTNGTAEGGSNAGSDLDVYRFTDAGAPAGGTTTLSINRSTGTTTLTPTAGQPALLAAGDLVVSRAGGTDRALRFRSGITDRWVFNVTSATESGSNAGSDLLLYRFNDAGAAIGGATLSIGRATGTLTLTPTGAADALALAAGGTIRGATTLTLAGQTGDVYLVARNGASGGYVQPATDFTTNLGAPSLKWGTIYSGVGTINTSSAARKEGITPLDRAACYQAAKDVVWYEFAYLPPAYTAPEPPPDIAYDAADDNSTRAEKKARRDEAEAGARAAHLKMVAETAPARHQRGFVFGGAEARDEAGEPLPPVPDLFGLSDRQSTTPQADLATLGCALQEVIRRLEALEAA